MVTSGGRSSIRWQKYEQKACIIWYVDVLAEFSKDGLLIPKEITWEDGRKYEITRVKDKRRAASTRAGGVGERYTCVVDGKEIFLFYEDNNMWFMERAGA